MTTTDIPRAQSVLSHPLDPLSEDEIRAVAATIRAERAEIARPAFSVLRLAAPDKDTVRGFTDGDPVGDRKAFAVVLDPERAATFEAVVDLSASKIESWREVPGVQAALTLDEIIALPEIVTSNPDACAALTRHGVTDLNLVQFDPWPVGTLPIDGVDPDRRLVRAIAYVREFPEDNGYARPVAHLAFVIDLTERRIVKIAEGEPIPLPPEHGNYDVGSVGQLRTDLRPVEITQPEGPSFQLDGNVITWQGWRLHAHVDTVEGLVISDVSYAGGGRRRPVLHRASISEMVVPYGDPSEDFFYRCAFDAGEYHLGETIAPLELGCDCLGEIRYLDAVLADHTGEPNRVRNAICIHEEDVGVLWKHWDFRYVEHAEVRRARRLVVSTICTVGNYEYGFFWYFYLDGEIEHEVKLTGIVQTRALAPGEETEHGTIVAPQLSAPNHQHLFCMRLDMEVDGPNNTVYEVDSVAAPEGDANPYGTAIVARATPISRESESARVVDATTDRRWAIVNPNATNRFGQPVSYTLVPSPAPLLLARTGSDVAKRAAFATRSLWVTRYAPDELHAAGDYPNQNATEDGVATWVRQDRDLTNTDVVVWHTFGVTHIPRPEDWPVMVCSRTGFVLRPTGFFDRNPTLNVPPPAPTCHA